MRAMISRQREPLQGRMPSTARPVSLPLASSLGVDVTVRGEDRGVSAGDLPLELPEGVNRARVPFESALSKTEPRDRLASNLARRLLAGEPPGW